MNADGSNFHKLTNDPAHDQYEAVFSPDGQQVLWVDVPWGGVGALGPWSSTIVVANVDGSNPHSISPANSTDITPDWGVDEPATPTPTPSPVPSGDTRFWGDNNCSGPPPDPVDSLLTLRYDAGLSTNTGDCPAFGTEVDVLAASLHLWGDIDCNDAVNPVDSLKLLRFDAGLSVAQEPDCPPIGSEVQILVP
jgi:hypothetical protein